MNNTGAPHLMHTYSTGMFLFQRMLSLPTAPLPYTSSAGIGSEPSFDREVRSVQMSASSLPVPVLPLLYFALQIVIANKILNPRYVYAQFPPLT